MIGGPPIVSAPMFQAYPQGYPVQQVYPAQQGYPAQWSGQPQGWPPARQPQAPSTAVASQTPAPKYRMQMAEEPTSTAPARLAETVPAPLRMPTPQELGLATASALAEGATWASTHRRLDKLGALSYHLDKLPQGGFRFACFLPTSRADRSHRIQAEAASETEAVSLVLEQAEGWAHGK